MLDKGGDNMTGRVATASRASDTSAGDEGPSTQVGTGEMTMEGGETEGRMTGGSTSGEIAE